MSAAPAPAHALVPVKRLAAAKSRLAPALSPRDRASLQRHMLRHVLAELLAMPELAGVRVISPDPEVHAIAATAGATTQWETPPGGLNEAVREGVAALAAAGARWAMVVPADLPDLDAAEAAEALALARRTGSPVVVPDLARTGTNALVVRAARPPAFQFGEESFARHLAIPGAVPCPLASFARDLDRPADLSAFRAARTLIDEEIF
ncbi:2-phospho-L-lactate guanylyltransferase [Acuticoccus mangrovi]|uniref:3-phospho-D-glycerate guanylyltransferase n=1 Tax=Acuticoccus mangrovi TaxID=2796142 RepID=A0A934IQ85_9HYPH|nr:2-phospho-L-lactate guanylyltransferase [Acuticoccus mangrovi]MBJ3776618.1 2-phospho-L-lactate guanylyltransferase [Acuticoccus mangrovi]